LPKDASCGGDRTEHTAQLGIERIDEAVSGGVWHACRIKVHQRTIRWCITKYESARSVDRIPVRCEECIGSMYSRACLGAMGGLFTVLGSIYEVACSHRRLIRSM
jgi:hypothetical protein